jgi:hypothetical protein
MKKRKAPTYTRARQTEAQAGQWHRAADAIHQCTRGRGTASLTHGTADLEVGGRHRGG